VAKCVAIEELTVERNLIVREPIIDF